MDKLSDEEQLRSDMMLETTTEVFLDMMNPAFDPSIVDWYSHARGKKASEKECNAFHARVREMTKGKIETKWSIFHIKFHRDDGINKFDPIRTDK